MSQYFPKPYEPFGTDISVRVDFSNYAMKADLKNISHIDISNFVVKSNLATLRAEIFVGRSFRGINFCVLRRCGRFCGTNFRVWSRFGKFRGINLAFRYVDTGQSYFFLFFISRHILFINFIIQKHIERIANFDARIFHFPLIIRRIFLFSS